LDAEAILAPIPADHPPLVITPHRGEIGRLGDKLLDAADQEEKEKLLVDYAREVGVTILLKGHDDIIVSPDGYGAINPTGHASMTVGGTGDVLGGIVASFIAQKLTPFEACCLAAFTVGLTGEELSKQKGNCYSATDVALELGYSIAGL
ncbi:MAG: Carbohydrate kinase, YjeF related protein, partial [Candidatus Peregrinibacteria bacterium GW2011_GWA2_47_7]